MFKNNFFCKDQLLKYSLNVQVKIKELDKLSGISRNSMFFIPSTEKIYFFGGSTNNGFSNDMNEYNFITSEFNKVGQKGDVPSPRDSCSTIFYGSTVYLFGGHGPNRFGSAKETFNDFYEFNAKTCEWKKIQLKGYIPEERICANCFLYKNKMYVIGGSDGSNIIEWDQLYEIDLITFVSKRYETGFTGGSFLCGCLIFQNENKFYYQGGTYNYKTAENVVLEIDVVNHTVSEVKINCWNVEKANTIKKINLPRLFCHYGFIIDKKRTVLFGGYQGDGMFSCEPNDKFHYLQFKGIDNIEYYQTETDIPTKCFSSSVKIGSKFYVFGGHTFRDKRIIKRTNEMMKFSFREFYEKKFKTSLDYLPVKY